MAWGAIFFIYTNKQIRATLFGGEFPSRTASQISSVVGQSQFETVKDTVKPETVNTA